MICFFLVGLRLEAVMIETGVLIDSRNTWHPKAFISFWLEVFFLICFLIVDCLMLYILQPKKWFDLKDRRLFLASAIDFLICSLCLVLLMISQASRCCDKNEKRFLAKGIQSGKDDFDVIVECCPTFGNRMYGGFGRIELFTSLIVLRLFRFWLAKSIIMTYDRLFLKLKKSNDQLHDDALIETENTFHPFDPLHEANPKETSHDNLEFQKMTGTIIDLWKAAVSKHPDIVEKYGEFSGPLLQAMLGIPILKDEDEKLRSFTETHSVKNDVRQKSFEATFSPKHFIMHDDQSKILQSSVVTTGGGNFKSFTKSYLNLQYKEANMSEENLLSTNINTDCSSVFPYESVSSFDENDISKVEKGKDSVPNQMLSGRNLNQAELGYPSITSMSDEIELLSFVSPNARLIRSMRRCDRKVLPVVDRWLTVDVVLTNYEIVYFDARDSEKLLDHTGPVGQRMKEVQQKIIATKGGKGLRLRDVAFGRKIVGTEVLTDIEEIHVNRVMPHEVQEDNEQCDKQQYDDEFWKCRHSSKNVDSDKIIQRKLSRRVRWSHVNEDQLSLRTAHSTLCLRFYGDLEHCETHRESMIRENETQGPLFKNNAFQWSQTIGRLVGIAKLKQDLPHFGDNTYEEVRDYLVVVDHHQNKVDRLKKMMSHRRVLSESLPANLLSPSTSTAVVETTARPAFSMTTTHPRLARKIPSTIADEAGEDEESTSIFTNRRRANTTDGNRITANFNDRNVIESTTLISSPQNNQLVENDTRPSVTWKS
jgi:hypothetical protein